MTRSTITLRPAVPGDAPLLATLWTELLRKGNDAQRIADCLAVIDRADASSDERLVVAMQDDQVAGAVYLVATTVSPLYLEPMVKSLAPTVFPQFARRGVGAALMDAAVTFAEERGIPNIAAAASTSSRDGNRFLARLALTPVATLRLAPTSSVRARLMALRPVSSRAGGSRQRDRVLAARRILRRDRVIG